MERIDLELSAFTRRAGSLLVAHSATTLARGLEPGERVLVHDRGHEVGYLTATVRDISFDLTDTHYRLELGARISADHAALLSGESRATAEAVEVSDILALLQAARALSAERSYRAGALPS